MRITGRAINLMTLLALLLAHPTAIRTLAVPAADDAGKHFVVEYYYKAKWGYADEFIQLFKKNHYPVLKKEKELGRILQISAVAPKYHTTEDGRWDYRVTIVWKNVEIAHDGFDSQVIIKQLFPDQATYKSEEQRRFEILAGHWDVPVIN